MENLNEDDQLAELKAWWAEYGRPVIFGVVLAVLGLGGWNFWSGYQNQQSDEASTIYYNMVDAYQALELTSSTSDADEAGQPSEKLAKLAEFQSTVTTLQEQYPKSEYAHYASLQNAKYLVGESDLEGAEGELRKVLASSPNQGIKILSQLRLAKVLFSAKKYDEALELTKAKNLSTYEASFKELAGDIYFKQGNNEEAFKSYALAREATETPSETLDMKYYNLLSE